MRLRCRFSRRSAWFTPLWNHEADSHTLKTEARGNVLEATPGLLPFMPEPGLRIPGGPQEPKSESKVAPRPVDSDLLAGGPRRQYFESPSVSMVCNQGEKQRALADPLGHLMA